jgi:hypothetical protein
MTVDANAQQIAIWWPVFSYGCPTRSAYQPIGSCIPGIDDISESSRSQTMYGPIFKNSTAIPDNGLSGWAQLLGFVLFTRIRIRIGIFVLFFLSSIVQIVHKLDNSFYHTIWADFLLCFEWRWAPLLDIIDLSHIRLIPTVIFRFAFAFWIHSLNYF